MTKRSSAHFFLKINCSPLLLYFGFFAGFFLLEACTSLPSLNTQAKVSVCNKARNVRVAFLDSTTQHPHQGKVLGVFERALLQSPLARNINNVRAFTFPLYDKQGNLSSELFFASIDSALKNRADIIHLSWNLALNSATQVLREGLVEMKRKHPEIFWVAAAGEIKQPNGAGARALG